ncbi:hypothetical protein LP419_04285 [Massilia sp. H-1]|nr:hypothetical protein LP419_04285 [Massilia sp. H-1]
MAFAFAPLLPTLAHCAPQMTVLSASFDDVARLAGLCALAPPRRHFQELRS